MFLPYYKCHLCLYSNIVYDNIYFTSYIFTYLYSELPIFKKQTNNNSKVPRLINLINTWLGGGFQYVLFPTLGKWSNLTHIFEMGWFNHQLDERLVFLVKSTGEVTFQENVTSPSDPSLKSVVSDPLDEYLGVEEPNPWLDQGPQGVWLGVKLGERGEGGWGVILKVLCFFYLIPLFYLYNMFWT